MRTKAIFCFFLLCCLWLMADPVTIESIYRQLPVEVNGWSAQDGCRFFQRKNLYDYIDGGAELYLSYGFNQLLSCRYSRPHQPDITLDIFDMGSSVNAFGVFSHSRETVDDSIGQGSEYSSGLLIFWKGKFFVSALVYPETPEAKKTVMKLGRQIADLIVEAGRVPAILGLLPRDGLIESSIRYFHHHIWLNSHYFISNENILNLDATSEAVLAAYQGDQNRYYILLVRYPDRISSQAACSSFQSSFLNGHRNGIMRMNDRSWSGCRQDENRLWVVLHADHREKVLAIFGSVMNSR